MRLFISYAHVDRYIVESCLVQYLKESGHQAWFDHELLPGQIWAEQLKKAITECDTFLYALSPESVSSYWCRWEFNIAAELQKRFVPVLLQSNTPIPETIKDFHFADFTNGPNNLALVKLLRVLDSSNKDDIYFLSAKHKLRLEPTVEKFPRKKPPKSNVNQSSNRSENTVNETWQEIAESNSKRLWVVAGPGTGKTYSMIKRVERLLHEGVDPRRILLITFSRTAARDLENAFEKQGISHSISIRKGTLHSFCSRLLRESQIWSTSGRKVRPLLDFERRFMLEDLSRQTREGIRTLEERLQGFETMWARHPEQEVGYAQDDADRKFYMYMMEWLRFHESILIEELVPQTLQYIRDNPGCPELSQFDHILVDEYQDLNRADQTLLDSLSRRASLTVIGDEDQAIYERLRYSHPEGIYNFAEVHQDAEKHSLKLCRRCPERIVAIANHFIEPNKNREGRKLLPRAENGVGELHIVQWQNLDSEANGIAKYIKTRVERGEFQPEQVLVLCSRRDFGFKIRDALSNSPYNVPSQLQFRQNIFKADPTKSEGDGKPELKAQERFTLLKLIADPDDRVALRCWLGFGNSSLRAGQYRRVWDKCIENDLFNSGDKSPREILDEVISGNLNISGIEQLVERYQALIVYQDKLRSEDGMNVFNDLFPENESWTSFFRAAIKNTTRDLTIEGILETIQQSIQEPFLSGDNASVKIMTLHQSKGLEADHVIVVGCIQGLIPSIPKQNDLRFMTRSRYEEEQRRMFYVAITRAKKSLVLSSTVNLPYSFAKNKGAEILGHDFEIARVRSSVFISKAELGSECPNPVFEDEWNY